MRLDRWRVHRSRVEVTCLEQQVLHQRSQRRVRVFQMFLRLYRREPGLDLQLSRQELIKQEHRLADYKSGYRILF